MDGTVLVREFHVKHEFPVNVTGKAPGTVCRSALREAIERLKEVQYHLDSALRTEQHLGTQRVRLIIEELRELAEAALDNDHVSIADAVGDITYLAHGTAVCYGIPLDKVVREIHRSNMTKSKSNGLKPFKGADYTPPRIAAVLAEHYEFASHHDGGSPM